MIIEFDPTEGLLEQKVWKFTVDAISQGLSKTSSKWIMISLKVIDEKGNKHEIRDFITLRPQWMPKLKQFLKSIGKIDDFDAGKLDTESYIGLTGNVETKQEYDEKMGAQNKVARYVEKSDELVDDDIPF